MKKLQARETFVFYLVAHHVNTSESLTRHGIDSACDVSQVSVIYIHDL